MDIRSVIKRFFQGYTYINILSIDIVAGAVISALFFGKILNVEILPYGLMALAITVWIIYTADHLRDAIVIKNIASSERHRFHQRNFKVLLALLVLATIVGLFIILYTRKPVLRWGINLSAIVLVYMVIQRYLKFLKEIFISILYTCGVLLPSMSVSEGNLTLSHYLFFGAFAMVALMNLLIFSWYDYDTDTRDLQRSFATTVGKTATRNFIYSLTMGVLTIEVYLLTNSFYPLATALVMMMAILHLLIVLFSGHLSSNSGYRIFAEAIFFIPVLYLIWGIN
jgi:4-hydroxybenzoate polyprenyltransferase